MNRLIKLWVWTGPLLIVLFVASYPSCVKVMVYAP